MTGPSHDDLFQQVFNVIHQLRPEASRENMSWHWLIQGGFLAGRRFLCGDLQAVWLRKNDTVEVLDSDGKRLTRFAWSTPMSQDAAPPASRAADQERRAA